MAICRFAAFFGVPRPFADSWPFLGLGGPEKALKPRKGPETPKRPRNLKNALNTALKMGLEYSLEKCLEYSLENGP